TVAPCSQAEVRRRATAAREAARNLVKRSQQLRDNADVLLREAEVLLQANQWALRWALRGREWPIRLLAYHPLPMKLRLWRPLLRRDRRARSRQPASPDGRRPERPHSREAC